MSCEADAIVGVHRDVRILRCQELIHNRLGVWMGVELLWKVFGDLYNVEKLEERVSHMKMLFINYLTSQECYNMLDIPEDDGGIEARSKEIVPTLPKSYASHDSHQLSTEIQIGYTLQVDQYDTLSASSLFPPRPDEFRFRNLGNPDSFSVSKSLESCHSRPYSCFHVLDDYTSFPPNAQPYSAESVSTESSLVQTPNSEERNIPQFDDLWRLTESVPMETEQEKIVTVEKAAGGEFRNAGRVLTESLCRSFASADTTADSTKRHKMQDSNALGKSSELQVDLDGSPDLEYGDLTFESQDLRESARIRNDMRRVESSRKGTSSLGFDTVKTEDVGTEQNSFRAESLAHHRSPEHEEDMTYNRASSYGISKRNRRRLLSVASDVSSHDG
jgi:hypothetical protein